ncbi:hypothetical protein Anas_11643 [Armadillidium nasatum]|uniref:Core Histone H2A/H2B/H3 domain-containing protein n=1 Tax=Armadillidium nasatum TaxID=96803 RepID=A0A5N5SJ52_9CRUS|nr:hypothetical protein Anas_11643 [Armadillidium nasatum]
MLIINNIFERIATEASRLAHCNKRSTITSQEIQTAVRLLLPGELAKHAVSEGTKAVTKYTSSKDSGIRMNLFQHFIDVNAVTFLPPLLFLLISFGDRFLGLASLLGGLAGSFGSHGERNSSRRYLLSLLLFGLLGKENCLDIRKNASLSDGNTRKEFPIQELQQPNTPLQQQGILGLRPRHVQHNFPFSKDDEYVQRETGDRHDLSESLTLPLLYLPFRDQTFCATYRIIRNTK